MSWESSTGASPRETERREGGRLRKLTGFQARIDDILPRTAAQLHVLWNGPDALPFIAEETVERAILVTEFDIQATGQVFDRPSQSVPSVGP